METVLRQALIRFKLAGIFIHSVMATHVLTSIPNGRETGMKQLDASTWIALASYGRMALPYLQVMLYNQFLMFPMGTYRVSHYECLRTKKAETGGCTTASIAFLRGWDISQSHCSPTWQIRQTSWHLVVLWLPTGRLQLLPWVAVPSLMVVKGALLLSLTLVSLTRRGTASPSWQTFPR
ncbi:uncharacterized protein LOC119294108 [Triticum dicoccoides]|uniref:uncharacterized protein LOC119294108 n=1 Tax=Triticum dicoccoides TaxID=85692 RepID=UPI00188E9268|nr:uncharacterized protein LOC119294108 [Triticum dicoccoides]